MPTDPRKKANPKTVNSILVDRGIRHAVYLTRLAGGEAKWIKEQMPQLRKAIIAAITPILADIDSSGIITATDEVLINEAAIKASKAAQEFFEEVQGEQMARLQDIAAFEADFEKRLFEKAIPVDINFRVPSDRQLQSFLTTEAISGKTMNQWFNDLTLTTRTLVNDAIRSGLIDGESIGDIVRRIRGRRENGFADGVLNTTTRHAEALARTGVMAASNKARREFHEANADVISGYEWVLTLDSRTCSICVSGESQNPYPVGSPPDLPAHVNCRCLRVAAVKSWEELGIDLDEAPPGTRASMNGEVPDTMTYEEWFNKQDSSLQEDILGSARFQAFKKGKAVTAFADNGKTLTLGQLRRSDPDLFSTSSIPEFVKAKTRSEAETLARSLGLRSVDYRGFDLQTANEINEGIHWTAKQFGLANENLDFKKTTKKGLFGYVSPKFEVVRQGAGLMFKRNNEYFISTSGRKIGDVNRSMKNSLKLNSESGFLPPNSSIQSVSAHEMTHYYVAQIYDKKYGVVNGLISKSQKVSWVRDWRRRSTSESIIEEALADIGKDRSHLGEIYSTLGKYSKANAHETISVAVQYEYDNPGKLPFAKSLIEVIKRRLE